MGQPRTVYGFFGLDKRPKNGQNVKAQLIKHIIEKSTTEGTQEMSKTCE